MTQATCPFEKAITSAQCQCEQAQRYVIAERMGVRCGSDLAANNCKMLLGLLRERSRFALKIADPRAELAFGKELKIMIGGLIGLRRLFPDSPEDAPPWVENVHALVLDAQKTYGSLSALPFTEIVKSVSAYQPKRRARTRR